MELFNCRVLIRHQSELENVRNAIEKRDFLIDKWNHVEQSIILPAKHWNEDDRIASIFTFRAVLVVLLSIMFVFPAIIIIPLLLYKYNRRSKLQKEIMEQQKIVNSALPIPLKQKDYKQVKDTYWGEKFISNGVIFLRSSELYS